LKKHLKKVTRIHKQSETAVGAFIDIEKQLQEQNEALDQVIDEMEKELSLLSDLWNQAKFRKKQNSDISERLREALYHDR
jgi:uncharacterized protein YukE